MASEQAVKAKRILISILSKLYNYGQLSSEVFFKFLNTKISPILIYDSEIWGTEYKQVVENIHQYACTRYMCVRLNSTNAAVLGECGRFPLSIQYKNAALLTGLRFLEWQTIDI